MESIRLSEHGLVAQVVERSTENASVGSANLSQTTTTYKPGLTGVEAMKMFKVIVFKCYENFIKISS